MASRQSLLLLSLEHLRTAESCGPERQERLITRLRAQRTALPFAPGLQSILATVRPAHAPLFETQGIRRQTRSTSNNRISYGQSRTRTDRNSNRGKTETTSGWHNRGLMTR